MSRFRVNSLPHYSRERSLFTSLHCRPPQWVVHEKGVEFHPCLGWNPWIRFDEADLIIARHRYLENSLLVVSIDGSRWIIGSKLRFDISFFFFMKRKGKRVGGKIDTGIFRFYFNFVTRTFREKVHIRMIKPTLHRGEDEIWTRSRSVKISPRSSANAWKNLTWRFVLVFFPSFFLFFFVISNCGFSRQLAELSLRRRESIRWNFYMELFHFSPMFA